MAMLGRGSIQDGSKASTTAQRRKAERVFRRQTQERKYSQKIKEGERAPVAPAEEQKNTGDQK